MPMNDEVEEFASEESSEQKHEEPAKSVESWFKANACKAWEVQACRVKNKWAEGKMLTQKEFLAGLDSARNVTSK